MAGNPFLTTLGTPAPAPVSAATPVPSQPSPNPFASALTPAKPQGSPNPFLAVLDKQHNAHVIDSAIGKPIVEGHKNWLGRFEDVAETPQRFALAAVQGRNPLEAAMNPKEGAQLKESLLHTIGEDKLEAPGAILDKTNEDLWHKLGRFVVHFGVDAATDPLTYAPVGKAAEAIGRAIPILGRTGAEISEKFWSSPAGRYLDPEATLAEANIPTPVRATAIVALHKSMQEGRAAVEKKLKEVRANAPAIRAGETNMKHLFHDPALAPEPRRGLPPQKIDQALALDQRPVTRELYRQNLQRAGLLNHSGSYSAFETMGGKPVPFYGMKAEEVTKAQQALLHYGATRLQGDNTWTRWAKALTHLGNQMFLAVPFPHGGNLTDLSYQEYGLGTTLRGLAESLQAMRGKETEAAKTMNDAGAGSKYGDIFSEHGLTGSPSIPGSKTAAEIANKFIVPLQRLSNYGQNKFLNPLETGLRAAAFKAEKAKGLSDEEAVRNIHRAFGSQEGNKLTRDSEFFGTPFAKFHGQTAIGSGLRTLARNPGRVTNVNKAVADFNEEVNPSGPQYRTSVPSQSTARSLIDPTHYYPSLLGPIGELGSNFSSLTELQKGHVAKALSIVLHRYIPVDQVVETIHELESGVRGQEGETGIQDIAPALVGGYYQKPKP